MASVSLGLALESLGLALASLGLARESLGLGTASWTWLVSLGLGTASSTWLVSLGLGSLSSSNFAGERIGSAPSSDFGGEIDTRRSDFALAFDLRVLYRLSRGGASPDPLLEGLESAASRRPSPLRVDWRAGETVFCMSSTAKLSIKCEARRPRSAATTAASSATASGMLAVRRADSTLDCRLLIKPPPPECERWLGRLSGTELRWLS